MRKYSKDGSLARVVCNKCGKTAVCAGGILKEDFFSAKMTWGYFSERDGETDRWDLCQMCYDKLIKSFEIKPEISEETELMTV